MEERIGQSYSRLLFPSQLHLYISEEEISGNILAMTRWSTHNGFYYWFVYELFSFCLMLYGLVMFYRPMVPFTEHGEGLQVLHYEVGQKYEPHFDYFLEEYSTANGGQMLATVLMYL